MKKAFITISVLLHLHGAYTQNTHYDSLKNLVNAAKDDSTKYWNTVALIWDYLYSYPDSAALYIQPNILLAQKMRSDEALYMGYSQYNELEQVNGNYPGALQYELRALRAAERTNDPISISTVYFSLGDLYRTTGDFEKAIYNLRKGKYFLDLKSKQVSERDRNKEIIRYYIFGFILFAKTFETFNQVDSAEKYANNARDYFNGVGKWQAPTDSLFLSRILALLMGDIYSKKGRYATAIDYYRSAAAMAIKDDVQKDVMDNYGGIATSFKKMGQLDSAIFYANKVLELSGLVRNISVKLDALTLLFEAYKLKHNTDSIAKYLELTVETKDSLFNQQKVMQLQNITFNEQLRQQEIKDQEQQYQNRLRMYMLAGGLLVVLLVAGILYRNNLHKQKAKVKIEKAYAELKSTQAQLIQSEKMASLGELTAGIAHEIQNPLNFVNNFSELNTELIGELLEQQKKEDRNFKMEDDLLIDIKDNEEKINYHGKRADAIVKGMLQHSRSSEGKKEATDINALTDEYLRLSYHGMRAKDSSFNATIKTDFDKNVGKVNIIPQDIGRVLLNLYNNAFYAVGERCKVRGLGYEPTVSISTKKVNDKIEISVKDNGNGIPDNVVDKIFQPFFTTKPSGQGTGLGLSLSYDIIKAHGGEIKVKTKAQAGLPAPKESIRTEALPTGQAGSAQAGAEFIVELPAIS